jgi:hypothetical protein
MMLTHSDACLPTLAASVTKRPCPRARRQCQGGRGGQGGGLERERVAAYAANGGQAGGRPHRDAIVFASGGRARACCTRDARVRRSCDGCVSDPADGPHVCMPTLEALHCMRTCQYVRFVTAMGHRTSLCVTVSVSRWLGRRVVRRPLVSESRGERGLVDGWRGRLLFAFAPQERLYSKDATGDAGRQRRPPIRSGLRSE